MGYRKDKLTTGQFYHVYNRGVEKRPIELDFHDRQRWVDTLAYYRFDDTPIQFSLAPDKPFIGQRALVRIIAYCLMPNHFHFILEQLVEHGVSEFMRKLTVSYSRYFNERHHRLGHLFQGPFQLRHIPTTELLLHISRYIHLNPFVAGLVQDLLEYRWSSYPIYLNSSQATFCDPMPVLEHFDDPDAYQKFVLDHADYARSLEAIKRLVIE